MRSEVVQYARPESTRDVYQQLKIHNEVDELLTTRGASLLYTGARYIGDEFKARYGAKVGTEQGVHRGVSMPSN